MFFLLCGDPVARVLARATCVYALLLLMPCLALAQPAALTLEDATRLAAERAPMLVARNAGVSAAEEEAERAGSFPDPMLVLGVDNLPITGRDALDFSADEMTMKRVGVRQEIPARAKREARRNFAARKVDEAHALSDAALLDVRRAAAQAWIELWTAQRELAAIRALRSQAATAADIAKARAGAGAEPISDALATDGVVLQLDNRIESVRATRAAAEAGLARWLGDSSVDAIAEATEFGSLPVSEGRLLAAIDRLGPLLPATAQVAAAAANIDVARAEKRSDWNVGASYGQRAGSRSDMFTIEVGFALPLFTRNRQDRGVAAREAEHAAALATREDLRREASARIRGDVARWESLKRQVARDESEVLPLARDRSATALAAYEAGGDVQAWLNAQRDEHDVQLLHAQHQGDLGRAWAALAYLLPTEAQP